MDIQKEREAFEQHLTDTGLVEFSDYGFAVDECDEYLHEPTQVAWDSWLIGLNRAKAQAVPDTYTPIVLALESVQSKIAKTSFLTMDEENENEVMAVNANELAAYIDELIEAQELAK